MNIFVSHSNALVSAGLVAVMQRIVGCKVESSAERARLPAGDAFQAIDLLVADSTTFKRAATRSGNLVSSRCLPKPQVVLLTATGEAGGEADGNVDVLPPGVSACLPMDCGPHDLLTTVCSLIGTRVPSSQAVDRSDGVASRKSQTKPHPRGGIAPAALRRVLEHIESNLAERVEIDELARVARLSACHFSRAFKQSIGMSPHRYLMSRRVVAATRLIEATERPMSEIAIDVGFSDQSHFTRVFTAHLGQSPRRFRHQRR